MIGSSRLNNFFNSIFGTPKIKIEVNPGIYGASSIAFYPTGQTYSSLATVSGSSGAYITHAPAGILFKGNYIVHNSTTSGLSCNSITTYTAGGSVLSQIGITNAPIPQQGSFYDAGETLIFDYIGGASGLNIRRYFSNNGTSWVGSSIIYTGTSQINSLVTTAEDTIYFNEIIESNFSYPTSSSNWKAKINRLKRDTSFGVTNILSKYEPSDVLYPVASQHRACLAGYRVGNFDYLLYATGVSTTYSEAKPTGIKQLEIDSNTAYILNTKTVVSELQSDYQIDLGSISKGITKYYMPMLIYNKSTSKYLGIYFSSTLDFYTWSAPLKVSNTEGSFKPCIPLVIAGTSSNYPLLKFFITDYQELTSTAGVVAKYQKPHTYDMFIGDKQDISHLLIGYGNNNNERISIRLGNMR